MGRDAKVAVAILLLAVFTVTPTKPGSVVASSVVAKKHCHALTKKVHGKKKRIKVCSAGKGVPASPPSSSPTTAPTSTPTPTAAPTSTPTPTATPTLPPSPYTTVVNDLAAGYEKIPPYNNSVEILPDGSVRFGFSDPATGADFSLAPHHYVINGDFAVRVNLTVTSPDPSAVIDGDVRVMAGDPSTNPSSITIGSASGYDGQYSINYFDAAHNTGVQTLVHIDWTRTYTDGLELRFTQAGSGETALSVIDSASEEQVGAATLPWHFAVAYTMVDLGDTDKRTFSGTMTVKKFEFGAENPQAVVPTG